MTQENSVILGLINCSPHKVLLSSEMEDDIGGRDV
jgi:hypothetical protein